MIPRLLGHIWIGPHEAPTEWMASWPAKHPDWRYQVFDNNFLTSRRWHCQRQIYDYFRRAKWAGVSDLMRYEILYEQGGFIAEADSICMYPVDELLTEDKAYTVYEFPNGRSGLMSPFLAAEPENPVIGAIIEEMRALNPEDMGMPWITTGNGFLRRFFEKFPELKREIEIFPSHYFIPKHYKEGTRYDGTDRVYAEQLWGTTRSNYPFRKVPNNVKTEAKLRLQAEILSELGRTTLS